MVTQHHWLNGQWIWANSRRRWRTGEPGVPQSTGSQRVGHDLATEQYQITMKNSLAVARTEGWGVHERSPKGGLGSGLDRFVSWPWGWPRKSTQVKTNRTANLKKNVTIPEAWKVYLPENNSLRIRWAWGCGELQGDFKWTLNAMGKRKIFNHERSVIRFGFYQGHSLDRITLKGKNQLVFYCERSIKGRK